LTLKGVFFVALSSVCLNNWVLCQQTHSDQRTGKNTAPFFNGSGALCKVDSPFSLVCLCMLLLRKDTMLNDNELVNFDPDVIAPNTRTDATMMIQLNSPCDHISSIDDLHDLSGTWYIYVSDDNTSWGGNDEIITDKILNSRADGCANLHAAVIAPIKNILTPPFYAD